MPPLTTLRVYYFVSFAALAAYLPFFPRWLEARGIQGLSMGLIAATFPAMGLVGPPCFGIVADAFQLRGSILRLACGGAFLAFSAIAAASLAGRPLGFGALLMAVAVFSLFRSPMVMMADVVALEQVKDAGTTYPRVRLWGSIGFLLTAVAVGRFVDPTELAPVPVAIAGGLFVALAASFALKARGVLPPRPVPGHVRALLEARDFRLFLAASFLGQSAQSAFDLCYSLHLRDLGASGPIVGVAWAIGVVAEVALMAWGGPLLARTTPPRLLALAFAAAAARWSLVAVVRSPAGQLALQPLHGLSFGLMWVASLAYTKGRASPHILATAQGLFTASTAAGSVAGMLTWGVLYRRAGGAATFGTAAAMSACAATCAAFFARTARE